MSADANVRRQGNMRANFLSMNMLHSYSFSSAKNEDKVLAAPLHDLWQNRLDAARRAISDSPAQFGKADSPGRKTLDAYITNKQTQLDNKILPAAEHKTFEKDLKEAMAEALRKELPTEKFGKTKYAKAQADRIFKEAVVKQLNAKEWKTVETNFEIDGVKFDNTMRPAAQMGFGDHNLFAKDYEKKGVASGTTKSYDHAVNLYASEMKILDPTEAEIGKFQGIRHGINSAYGLPAKSETQKKAREQASINRSEEVIVAALGNLKPDEVRAAMKSGAVVPLRLSSTSLVTALNALGQTEGKQMRDQVNAWETLNQKSKKDGHITVKMRDENNVLQDVKVRFEAAPMNFGVNEAALTHKIGVGDFSIKLDAGWDVADKVNHKALTTMLGEGIHTPGGHVGGWTRDYMVSNFDAKNLDAVRELSAQIGEIWQQKSHRTDKHKTPDGQESAVGDPYKLAARMAVLSQEIGAAPCYNCKSGKDRTGALDGEIKFLVAYHALHKTYPEPGAEFTGSTRDLYRKCMMETGNGEIQKQNTGAEGNKVFKKLSFNNLSMRDRVGSDSDFDSIKGQSGLVKS